ncbi:MAG: tRNA-specific adenosine deaminase [bacterium]|nr:tRNA-specific adenosine deaminase [bacterium]
MGHALELAREAGKAGEVPVGAVVVLDGTIVGSGANSPIGSNDPTAHAEIVALRDAAERAGNYRLTGATLYATVEPCLMCFGAAIHARIGRLVYGARDPKVGTTSRIDALTPAGVGLNHEFEVIGGIREREASGLLAGFFRERRDSATAAVAVGT